MFDPLQCASAAFLVGTAALVATGTAWSQQQVVMSASFSRRRRQSFIAGVLPFLVIYMAMSTLITYVPTITLVPLSLPK
jgi:hypothetical protein